MELLIEELGGSVIMLLLGSGVIGVLVYVRMEIIIIVFTLSIRMEPCSIMIRSICLPLGANTSVSPPVRSVWW